MLTINFFLISMIYSLCLGTFTGNHPMYDEYILYLYTLIWIIYTFQWILFGYGFGVDKSKVSPEEAPRWQGGITGCCSTLLNNPIDVAWHQKSSPCDGGSSPKNVLL
jgi:hypothetical protein